MKYLFVVFAAVLCSCQVDHLDTLSITDISDSNNYRIEVNSGLIDGGQLTSLKTEENGSDYLYRTRPFAGAIQSIDLKDGTVRTLNFPEDGPDGVRRLQSFLVNENGGYFVAADERLLVLDVEGQIQQDLKLYPNNVDLKLNGPYIIRATHEYPPQQYKDKLIVHLERDDSDDHSFPYHYEGPFLGALSVMNRETTPLPVEWPEQNEYYGFIHQPFFSVVGDDVIYGFSFSPDLYRLSLTRGTKETIPQPAFNGHRNVSFTGSFDESELLMHKSKSVVYGRLIYDEQSKKYCQILFVPPDSSHPMYGIAQFIGVRYFDESLNLLGEMTLPRGMAPEAYFIDGHLYVRHVEGVSENTIFLREILTKT